MTIIRKFNRYELKYILPVEKCRRIARDLLAFTSYDEHGGKAGYRVISLYYDSPSYDFFWAKIEGIKFRRKIRIRLYPGTDQSQDGRPGEDRGQAMVEIKQRINRTVQKRRLALPLPEAENLCAGSYQIENINPVDQQVASEVQYLVNAMHLRPACITAYRRQAFVGNMYEPGLRITFDTDLRYRIHALKADEKAENHLFLPPDWCIMEVKADNAVPDWVTSLLAYHNCQLRRISKYCAGLALGTGTRVSHFAISPHGDRG